MITFLAAIAIGSPQLPVEALDAWAAPAGLQIVRLRVAEGDAVVYLPSRIAPGDQVSGSAFLEPVGPSAAEMSRNHEVLAKNVVEIMGSAVDPHKVAFTVRAPEDGSPITLILRTDDGGTAVRATASSSPLGAAIDEPSACPLVEVGTAIRVVGRFDGNRETTSAWIDGQMVGVLAEGSRDCVVSTLNVGVGPHRLKLKEGNVESEHMVNIVRIDVKPPVDARVGKKTVIEVAVDGLDEADPAVFPFSIVMTNNMPKLFPFGGESSLVVNSGEVQNGRWSSKLEFKPKARGNFAMSARLVCDSFLKRIGL